MQLQGLLIMLFILAVIPIMILSSNHEIFFILMAVILLVSSVKNLYRGLLGANSGSLESDSDPEEDLEEILDLDMEKFGIGIDIAKSLITILFLAYCAFYLNFLFFKAATALAILLQVYFIVEKIKAGPECEPAGIHGIGRMLSSLLTLVIVLFTVFNKLTGNRF
jgi:hypothetical protein